MVIFVAIVRYLHIIVNILFTSILFSSLVNYAATTYASSDIITPTFMRPACEKRPGVSAMIYNAHVGFMFAHSFQTGACV